MTVAASLSSYGGLAVICVSPLLRGQTVALTLSVTDPESFYSGNDSCTISTKDGSSFALNLLSLEVECH